MCLFTHFCNLRHRFAKERSDVADGDGCKAAARSRYDSRGSLSQGPMHSSLYVCTYIYIYINVCKYLCIYMYVYTYASVGRHEYIYIHIQRDMDLDTEVDFGLWAQISDCRYMYNDKDKDPTFRF